MFLLHIGLVVYCTLLVFEYLHRQPAPIIDDDDEDMSDAEYRRYLDHLG